MYKFWALLFFTGLFHYSYTQKSEPNASIETNLARPKLVVGLVIDQMRWDFLYRYYDRYQSDGGFKRLLSSGFSCENTFINYTPSFTACGHTSIYTGSVPAIHGITGNDWWDYTLNKFVYCTDDDNETTVGSNTSLGKMSPRNLLVTTITDELRLATNFRSKVIGIAIKDRGAILPAGHTANAAYWYDNKTGNWITSSYYMKELPSWAMKLNAKKLVDKYYELDWKTVYPLKSYEQSIPDTSRFPHLLKPYIGKNYGVLPATPYGNSFTFDMAQAAVAGEQLGLDSTTDFLAISLSTPDYIGHTFGPNSAEAEDSYLRLDKDLAGFLNFLDEKVGKGNYLFFLTADHGAAHDPSFIKGHKIPAGNVISDQITNDLNSYLGQKTMVKNLVIAIENFQVVFDRRKIDSARLNIDSIHNWAVGFLVTVPGVDNAIVLKDVEKSSINNQVKEAIINGYYPRRCGDIQLIYQPQWIDGFKSGGTTHGSLNPYDTHIPLLWYGWNIRSGVMGRKVYITDIASTLAYLLHVQMPNGSIGQVIEEVVK